MALDSKIARNFLRSALGRRERGAPNVHEHRFTWRWRVAIDFSKFKYSGNRYAQRNVAHRTFFRFSPRRYVFLVYEEMASCIEG